MYLTSIVVLIPYFLYSSYKSHNSRYHPSSFWYCILPILLEFSIICTLVSFCVYYLKYCQHSYYIIPIILLLLGLAFILALDLIFIVVDSLSLDLFAWLRLDFHGKRIPDGSYHAVYFSRFAKDVAYEAYSQREEILDCPICLDPFAGEPDAKKSLLACGHLFHSECLDEWEQDQWTDDPFGLITNPKPLCRCPSCRDWYHSDFEKFEYDKDHQSSQPSIYPGVAWTHETFWNQAKQRYIDHSESVYRSHSRPA